MDGIGRWRRIRSRDQGVERWTHEARAHVHGAVTDASHTVLECWLGPLRLGRTRLASLSDPVVAIALVAQATDFGQGARVFALLILRTTPGEEFFALVNTAFIELLGYTQDGARFPNVTLFDNVACQHRLLTEHLGVRRVALVLGWSMAAMQAYQWAAQYPDMVGAILPYCGAARCSTLNHAFLDGPKAALQADCAWNGGDYAAPPEKGLRAFGRVYASWAYSHDFFADALYRVLGFETLEDLVRDWEEDHLHWDANDLIAKIWTWQNGDISRNDTYAGDLTSFLFGDILGVDRGDIVLGLVALVVTIVALVLGHRSFLALAVNHEKAAALGLRPGLAHAATVSGKISNFRFVNPHVLIYANVETEDGTMVEWSGELTSPNRLARGRPTQTSDGVAWSKTILQPGDEVTLTGNPARNGAPSLRLLKVVKIVDGKEQVLVDD